MFKEPPGPQARCSTYTTSTATRIGDQEQVPSWWIGQLHKSLFDEDELRLLLRDSGFSSSVVFCYAYPGDVNEMPVNMGFFSKCMNIPSENLRDECLAFLTHFRGHPYPLEHHGMALSSTNVEASRIHETNHPR